MFNSTPYTLRPQTQQMRLLVHSPDAKSVRNIPQSVSGGYGPCMQSDMLSQLSHNPSRTLKRTKTQQGLRKHRQSLMTRESSKSRVSLATTLGHTKKTCKRKTEQALTYSELMQKFPLRPALVKKPTIKSTSTLFLGQNNVKNLKQFKTEQRQLHKQNETIRIKELKTQITGFRDHWVTYQTKTLRKLDGDRRRKEAEKQEELLIEEKRKILLKHRNQKLSRKLYGSEKDQENEEKREIKDKTYQLLHKLNDSINKKRNKIVQKYERKKKLREIQEMMQKIGTGEEDDVDEDGMTQEDMQLKNEILVMMAQRAKKKLPRVSYIIPRNSM